jgi:hypothetical protein
MDWEAREVQGRGGPHVGGDFSVAVGAVGHDAEPRALRDGNGGVAEEARLRVHSRVAYPCKEEGGARSSGGWKRGGCYPL